MAATETIEQKVKRLEGAVDNLSRTVANQAGVIKQIADTVKKLIKENEEPRKAVSKG